MRPRWSMKKALPLWSRYHCRNSTEKMWHLLQNQSNSRSKLMTRTRRRYLLLSRARSFQQQHQLEASGAIIRLTDADSLPSTPPYSPDQPPPPQMCMSSGQPPPPSPPPVVRQTCQSSLCSRRRGTPRWPPVQTGPLPVSGELRHLRRFCGAIAATCCSSIPQPQPSPSVFNQTPVRPFPSQSFSASFLEHGALHTDVGWSSLDRHPKMCAPFCAAPFVSRWREMDDEPHRSQASFS